MVVLCACCSYHLWLVGDRYHPALVGVVVKTLQRCPDALVVFASTVSSR